MPQTNSHNGADSIEQKLLGILAAQDLGDITQELCDFSLEEQNATAEAQGIQPSASADYIPVLGKSVTYIVASVLFNERDEVLMMQEAKQSCAGKWYLPAGRMEKGETICEAAVREVYEETGLNVDITTLLAIEVAGGSWFRFVLTGRVTGGQLKTPAQADNESLQAKWIGRLSELPLRANDILNLIDIGRSYNERNSSPQAPSYHPDVLPTKYSHHKNYLRVVAVIRKRATNSLNVLVSEKNVHHFPTVEVHPQRSLHSTLRKFMIELFGAELPQHRPHGILSVEHCPSPMPYTSDGICLNVLVVFRPPLEEVALIGKCTWHELSRPLEEKLGRILSSKHSTIPLNVIR
ncbi:PREDICTED: 8-oxo-dGDP phosphatase NUDT18 [Bactrocera latifrons]|uniref:Nucleoside diphosphate-linked moiety X motif 18 n=1 Tax=Bactrocera latifrons TaxID=174628 RepID=A0A0K8VDR4_BACLA|nr:PREDICTED: 8-oxo-dGDP phosphatase NUDT18 [Bactrocera latifrons]XP_018799055.1 PREDICTED: 8-oxo-dGDP phosphatase NUDT18 [Bactrocera latifrons]XP_018799056.1 PREDICTED: 8-oxo-dGDP phosphatase NUDT18 [Bactrocera latifrons]XP_018799057.1 PREDICTED: 8-oxo-dGDP phosphatase NUDT18 [Bactrocera latifrons]